MKNKRATIYDLAKALGISPSYVSKALHNHPAISERVKHSVKKKAAELNYKQNTHAANLRRGSTNTIGVIVPHINQSFFSEVIAGIEEVCFQNGHSLVICQSHESFLQECKAIDTLIHQDVDCILISVSAQTQSYTHLENIKANDIELIQFDRYMDQLDSYKVLNDNKEVSYNVVSQLIAQGYKNIAFLGGPEHLAVFSARKEGYLSAIKDAGLSIPHHFVVDNVLPREQSEEVATELLKLKQPPDAFLTVSDHQSLAVLQVADLLGLKVPQQLGIFGFANEFFTKIMKPTLSSVDQKSKDMGKSAANIYFNSIVQSNHQTTESKVEIIKSEIIVRQSSQRTFSEE
jgi:DNA-binding LacI/PurR family transcriptional regulator